MKAYLHSTRLAPKKANLIAMMVRGMRVEEALTALEHTNKKGARLVETLLRSAVANAEHNDKQRRSNLVIKSIVVNQGTAYRRGTPMARGRMRPMNKFLSHIDLVLGIAGAEEAVSKTKKKKIEKAEKSPKAASQSKKNAVKESASKKETSSSASPES